MRKAMQLLLPTGLPAIERLRGEGIEIENDEHAGCGGYAHRRLRVALLNLMPFKEETETDFVRLLTASSVPVELVLMKLSTHTPKHTSAEHMNKFYLSFDDLKATGIDGLIVTGAPVEQLDFEEVTYWDELKRIFSWAQSSAVPTLYICWAAQAGLYFHYGIPKYSLPRKKFGIFQQTIIDTSLPLFSGIANPFPMPHSRHTEIHGEDILADGRLQILAQSPVSGVSIVSARGGAEIFVTGHMEYASHTLGNEYRRDYGKRDDVDLPVNYFTDDNPEREPLVSWRESADKFFDNWLRYYVAKI